MKILYLGKQSDILSWLQSKYFVVKTEVKFTESLVNYHNFDMLISYGYRHIIKKEILDMFKIAINLHISYLPWNRGADPNIWSFVENTPKGVTIHYMDEGIDTGDIIAQEEVFFEKGTLESTYNTLETKIQILFILKWESIINGTCKRVAQTSKGTYHNKNDFKRIEHLVKKDGWKTDIEKLKFYI